MRIFMAGRSLMLQFFYKLKYRQRIDLGTRRHSFGHRVTLNIQGKSSIIALKKVNIFDNVHLSACEGGKLSIGNNVFFNRGDCIVARDSITIGDDCSFGPNVCVYDHDHYFDKTGVLKGKYKTSPIVIGNKVWIASNVVIIRGTKIGDGCIIGAGTIVHGDIPPYSIVRNGTSPIIEKLR